MDSLLDTQSLGPMWISAYGISTRRFDAFLRRPETVGGREPDSFYSHTSETALTLFVLARSDKWLQARFCDDWPQHPRPNGESWNREFFLALREGQIVMPATPTPLRRLLAEMMGIDEANFTNAVLLFELQANRNYALSTDRAIETQDITFCGDCEAGTKFDAVLAMPNAKRLICIEAKLNAQQGANQIIRGLEAAFFLTKVKRSVFEGWDFSYLFLHPPGSQYENDYAFIGDSNRALAKYGDELSKGEKQANGNFSDGNRWQEFVSSVPLRVYEREWPVLLRLLKSDGWDEVEYHRRIGQSQLVNPDELVKASESRLRHARRSIV